MSKTTNKFSPEVRQRAIRMVLYHEAEHPSRWAAVSSIAAKVGCSPATLHKWVKKTEVDSGKRAGLPSDVGEKMKALERENGELRQANEILCKAFAYWTKQAWLHNLNETASGKPGAFQSHTIYVLQRVPTSRKVDVPIPPALLWFGWNGRCEIVIRDHTGSVPHKPTARNLVA